jgi:hypothetical protein
MIPDPATTPLKPWHQAAFGFAVAMVYGIIQVMHLVFGLFFALVTVCAIRGASLHLLNLLGKLPGKPAAETIAEKKSAPAPALASVPSALAPTQRQQA